MINTEQLRIDKMIIHKVDHWKYDSPQLADLESPVSEEIASFLRHHIADSFEHRFTRTAIFNNPQISDYDFQDACNSIANDPNEFISISRSISCHLFNTIDGDKRISPSDLIICTFTQGDHSSKWLAILKMNPVDGFVSERETVKKLVRYVLRRVPDVLPTGVLQKCAFILPQEMRRDFGYDLKVLDQQVARFGVRRKVASFFVKDFLQCKVELNKKDKTKSFISGSSEWIKLKEDGWHEADVKRFQDRVYTTIKENIVDLSEFAQAVIAKPEDQDEYLQYMRETVGLEELTFDPDPEERRRLTEYTWFEGDDELLIRIKTDAIGPDKTLNPGEPGADQLRTIIIKTKKWESTPTRGR